MKSLLLSLLMSFSFLGMSQSEMHSSKPEECIKSFFKAFHAQDTIALKKVIHDDVVLATIKSNEKDTVLLIDDMQEFYKSIASIPETMKFQEELTEIEIRTEGILAQVWTHYAFYLNDEVSHKGVNAFTLINEGGSWKIIYLVDTRRKG